MENASKALIIAGAILISILLITLGITLYNSSKGTTDQATQLGDTMGNGAQSAVGQLGTALGVDGSGNMTGTNEVNEYFKTKLGINNICNNQEVKGVPAAVLKEIRNNTYGVTFSGGIPIDYIMDNYKYDLVLQVENGSISDIQLVQMYAQ